jgi:hypothetical protein
MQEVGADRVRLTYFRVSPESCERIVTALDPDLPLRVSDLLSTHRNAIFSLCRVHAHILIQGQRAAGRGQWVNRRPTFFSLSGTPCFVFCVSFALSRHAGVASEYPNSE